MTTNNKPRLSSEMLATADALRNIRLQLHQLASTDNPAVKGVAETTTVLIEGPIVADALEALGQRVGIVN